MIEAYLAGYMGKEALDPGFWYAEDTIPINTTMSIFEKDPYLDYKQKRKVLGIVASAEPKTTGLVSGRDLTKAAIRAGTGFVAGHLFGRGVGKLLGLPTPVVKKLSRNGGLALATINTGIFNLGEE